MGFSTLVGHAFAKVDEKGRLKVPNNFRLHLEERYGPDCFITSREGDRALIYPVSVWEEVLSRLAKMPSTSVAKIKFLERTNYFGKEATIDSQGRLLLPAILRDVADIKDEVVVLGNESHLEVWSHVNMQRRLTESPMTADDYKELELHGV